MTIAPSRPIRKIVSLLMIGAPALGRGPLWTALIEQLHRRFQRVDGRDVPAVAVATGAVCTTSAAFAVRFRFPVAAPFAARPFAVA